MFSSSTTIKSNGSGNEGEGEEEEEKKVNQQSKNLDLKLSHINHDGSAMMVDISEKSETRRVAQAMSLIYTGPQVLKLIADNQMTKGDVLSTARIAGILATKSTASLIPLCHPLQLNKVTIDFKMVNSESIQIDCTVSTIGRTGVEMEALTGVSVAALTIYDMCKSVNKSMVIKETRLISKTGGKCDYRLKRRTTERE